MNNAHKFARRTGLILSIVVFVVGFSILYPNIEYLEYTNFFGKDIVNEFQEYVDWGLMRDTSGIELLQKKGNTAFIGVLVMASSVIVFIISRLIANSYIVAENSEVQTDLLKSTVPKANVVQDIDTVQRLKHLSRLRDEGLITEDEFSRKRNEIISHL